MKNYRKRIADDILRRKLEGKGAVLIEGPKWCGKTTTAEQLAASVLYMDEPEKKEQNIAMSELSPKRLLKGRSPRRTRTIYPHRFCRSGRYNGNNALRNRSLHMADNASHEPV